MNMRHEPSTAKDSNGAARAVGRPRHNSVKTASAQNLTGLMGDDMIVKPGDAAAILGFTRGALDQWYAQGEGPRPIVIHSRRIGYRVAALRQWIREHERGSGT